MAGAALGSAILQTVLEKLASGAIKELGLLCGAKKDLESLKSTLFTIQDVLEDAEERSIKDKPLLNWLKKLKDAAYDADDMLDEFEVEGLLRRAEVRDNLAKKVRYYFSPSNPILFRFKMSHKVKEARERLDAIATERAKFHLERRVVSDRMVDFGNRETVSTVDEFTIYGRNEDQERVTSLLMDTDHIGGDITVIPIVGMGGVGKTTLAQLVFNDNRIRQHFELRVWVCVSEDFDVVQLGKTIIESASGGACNLRELERIRHNLHSILNGKRFLLVLDDVWNENAEKWEKLEHLLRVGAIGSKILVTTRSERVALTMGTDRPYFLKSISDDDCWALFKQKAFGMERRETPSLAAIGKEIVAKCGGIPLAAKALGSLMRFKRDESEWRAVRDSKICELPEDENRILSALRLSYVHLSSHLKRCFAYCSIFPKDFRIYKDVLIELWIAEGFIRSTSEGTWSLEDMGKDYFNNLLWRSFFQDMEMDDYGRVTCKMHDLVHDLAQSVAGDECSIVETEKTTNIPERCRYASLVANNFFQTVPTDVLSKANKLRTLFLAKPYQIKAPPDMFTCLTCLRSLDLNDSGIEELPESIRKLKHLRYLNLSSTPITAISECIGSLQNLRTLNLSNCFNLQALPGSLHRLFNLEMLDLQYCDELRELPEGMSNMVNLRHLNSKGCTSLSSMPPGIGRLRRLQTLSLFAVGAGDRCSSIAELEHLNLISGELKITNLDNVRNPPDAERANLKEKLHLQSLTLSWGQGVHEDVAEGEVLESLKPHPNLEALVIVGYRGITLPGWMMERMGSSLPNLATVKLIGLTRCTSLPPLWQLRALTALHVEKMYAIRQIGLGFYGIAGMFSSMQQFVIKDMPNLEVWWTFAKVMNGYDDNGGQPMFMSMFPCLSKLEIFKCPKLRVWPFLPMSIVKLTVEESNEELLSEESLGGGQGNSEESSLSSSSSSSFLRELKIVKCKASGGWKGLRYLTSLEKISIVLCDDLSCLPESVRHLTSLRHLVITCCQNFVALPEWLGEFCSLQSLEISECDNLGSLPQGLQCLSALVSLSVHNCPHLQRRCRRLGEDWHKIKHIPAVNFSRTR